MVNECVVWTHYAFTRLHGIIKTIPDLQIVRSIVAAARTTKPNQFSRRRGGGAVPESPEADDSDTDRRRVSGVGYDVLSTRVIDPPPHRGASAYARPFTLVVAVLLSHVVVVVIYYFYTILIYAIVAFIPDRKTLRRECTCKYK